jgi:hypothetical protein
MGVGRAAASDALTPLVVSVRGSGRPLGEDVDGPESYVRS